MQAEVDIKGVAHKSVDGRKLKFRLGVFGLHIVEEDSGDPKVHHAAQFISYEDLLAKAERQMTLL
jgi:hypothetical protein